MKNLRFVLLGLLLSCYSASAMDEACRTFLEAHLEHPDSGSSPHFHPVTGDGMVILRLEDLDPGLTDLVLKSYDRVIAAKGSGAKHQLQFLPDGTEASSVLEPELLSRLVQISFKIQKAAAHKVPQTENEPQLRTADIRYVNGTNPHSTYVHYDYYDGDQIVGVASFKNHGMAVKVGNKPNGRSIVLPPGYLILFNGIARWQMYHGVEATDAAREALLPYMDVKASRAGHTENIGNGPEGLEDRYKKYLGALPVIHHAPELPQDDQQRASLSVVLGPALLSE